MSNLSDLLNNTSNSNASAFLGNVLGTAADISGGIGFVLMVMDWLQGDQSEAALQNILTTIQNDFAQLNAGDKAEKSSRGCKISTT